jgi:hypothetical protein
MALVMSDRSLRLHLRAGESLPCNVSWLIDDGFLRVVSWSDQSEDLLTLGLWGPGDLVIPALIGIEPLQLMSLSAVQVEEVSPTSQQQQQFLLDHLHHTSTLLLLSRVRPAETRLFRLLLWLGERFGRVNSRGVSLSFDEMNLTHRHLADIAGTTRVTVTKALTRFRQEGSLLKEGADELLLPSRFIGGVCD